MLLLAKSVGVFLASLIIQQTIVQIIMIIVRAVQPDKRHILLVWGRWLTGFSCLAAELGSGISGSTLVYTSFYFTCIWVLHLSTHFSIFAALGFTLLYKWSAVYIIFQLYTQSIGMGLNFYYKGKRIIGFDFWISVENK